MDERQVPVLILAPTGRDAAVAGAILGEGGLVSTVCPDLDALVSGLDRAGGVIVTEEAQLHSDRRALAAWIHQQAPWSELSLCAAHLSGRPRRCGPDRAAGECDHPGVSLPSLGSRQCRAMRHPGQTAPARGRGVFARAQAVRRAPDSSRPRAAAPSEEHACDCPGTTAGDV